MHCRTTFPRPRAKHASSGAVGAELMPVVYPLLREVLSETDAALISRVYEAFASPYQLRWLLVKPYESFYNTAMMPICGMPGIDRMGKRASADTRTPCFRVNQKIQAPNQGIVHVE